MDLLVIVALFGWPILVLWLANLADRRREEGDASAAGVLSGITYGLLMLTYGLLILIGLGMVALGRVAANATEMADAMLASGFDSASLGSIGLSLWAPSILGLILLLRPTRGLLARFINIEVDRTVHAVALSFIALILINLFFTLGVGLNRLADAMEASTEAGVVFNAAALIWVQDIMLAAMGLIGVGWLARRGVADAMVRLGIVVPTWRQVLIGVTVGLLLVPAVLALEALLGRIGMGTDADVERLTEQMVGPLTRSAFGILTLGLAAALGEETVFRGALQPRFGLIVTSILFAMLHSTYGLSLSTGLVLLVGLVLGLLRMRHNTTTTMITHAVYNMTLGIIALLGLLENF